MATILYNVLNHETTESIGSIGVHADTPEMAELIDQGISMKIVTPGSSQGYRICRIPVEYSDEEEDPLVFVMPTHLGPPVNTG